MGTHDRDQFDDLLDGALKRYGEVEPRTGLEGRILSRLAEVDLQPRWWMRWAWGLAVAACACIAIVLVVRSSHSHQPVSVHSPTAGAETAAKNAVAIPDGHARPVGRRSRQKSELANTLRRPTEFPSRRPLSTQEAMLVEYVEQFPKDAILIAKEQDEFQKRVEQSEKEIDANSSLDQQER